MIEPYPSKPVTGGDSPLLSPEMLALLRQHFWCDFSDIIPALKWEEKNPPD